MVRAYVGSFLSLAGAACGMTWLFLSMRAVMDVGGACADGGPYVSAQPCPEGVSLLTLGGIFGGLICLGLFAWCSSGLGGSYGTLALFAWPALFLSLGWNFLEYGIDPPGDVAGPEIGWLVCAVLFALMGGLPLLILARPSFLRSTFWPADPPRDATGAPPMPSHPAVGGSLGRSKREPDDGSVRRPGAPGYDGPTPAAAPPGRASRTPAPKAAPRAGGDEDVVARLERLAALRERGALDAEEFERAKKAVLGG